MLVISPGHLPESGVDRAYLPWLENACPNGGSIWQQLGHGCKSEINWLSASFQRHIIIATDQITRHVSRQKAQYSRIRVT